MSNEPTVTIVLPPGYDTAEAFALDCGFELVPSPAATPPSVEEAPQAVFGAYLGLLVLQTMCKKARLSLAEQRAKEIAADLDEAYPGLAARSALRGPRVCRMSGANCEDLPLSVRCPDCPDCPVSRPHGGVE